MLCGPGFENGTVWTLDASCEMRYMGIQCTRVCSLFCSFHTQVIMGPAQIGPRGNVMQPLGFVAVWTNTQVYFQAYTIRFGHKKVVSLKYTLYNLHDASCYTCCIRKTLASYTSTVLAIHTATGGRKRLSVWHRWQCKPAKYMTTLHVLDNMGNHHWPIPVAFRMVYSTRPALIYIGTGISHQRVASGPRPSVYRQYYKCSLHPAPVHIPSVRRSNVA